MSVLDEAARRAISAGHLAHHLLQRLARTYLGPDVKFPPFDNPPAGAVVRITPERVAGGGSWAG